MSNVVSAAIISGELIIGLDSGEIIRCGYVQGPPGLKGDQGPQGATGPAGVDGNTIHTVEGTPDGALGKDGDYAINRVEWRIHGPKAGGRWPQGVDMLAKGKSKGLGAKGSGGNGIITGGGSGGNFTGDVFTNTVIASGTGRLAEVPRNNSPYMAVTYPGSPLGMIPQRPGMAYQSNINAWIVDALEALEVNIPVFIEENEPTGPGVFEGMLWYNPSAGDVTLYVQVNGDWVPVMPPVVISTVSDTPPTDPKQGDLWWDSSPDSLTLFVYEGTAWVPAAPPVSLDGINATIDAALIVQNDLLARVQSGEVAQATLQDTVADALDIQVTLQHKVEALEGTVIDGKWYAESRSTPREGGFDITSGGLQSMSDWNADFLRVHKTDSTGKVFTFAEVSTGDYIRIGAPGSTAVYKINEAVSGSLDWQAFGVELANSTGTPIPDLTYDFEFLPSFDPSAYATIQYVDAQDDLDVKKTGDTMTGNLNFTGGDRTITAQDGNRLRMGARDSSNSGRTFIDIQTADSSGTEGADSGYRCRIYHLATPTAPLHAANKKYVDEQIAAIPAPTGGVPVGSIMIWMNSTAPDGWFKLQGGTFDTVANPQLHTYLQSTTGYVAGTLPDWSGRYPGEYGDHISNPLGSKQNAKTGKPLTGGPRSSASIPNGNTRTFTATGGTNAYSDGKSKVTIDENWDSVTRPPTVVVHYIIKHD